MVLLFSSCGKEGTDVTVITPVVDPPSIDVNASVVGVVTDEAGAVLEDAIVQYGELEATTNEFGYFSFNNVKLYKDGTFLSVSKPGYFPGSRKFYPRENEASNISIQLLEKLNVGTVDQSIGGAIPFSKASVNLPSGDYTLAGGGVYSGAVEVYAKWLDPTDQNTFSEMPGDLTGYTTEGEVMALSTFGMIAVELESDSGQKLALPEGTTANISLEVPVSLLGVAPATIPLWHFDETNGIWIEEGFATLVDGKYEGEVSHFSFWNCDYPSELVNIEGQVYLYDDEYENAHVLVTVVNSGFQGSGYTNSNGFYTGKVPKNEALKIEVLDPCGNSIFNKNIGPFADDQILDAIFINETLEAITVYGSVDNCTGDQIDASYAIIKVGEQFFTANADANGDFSSNLVYCVAGDIEVYGVDVTNSLISPAANFAFDNSINAGTLIACDDFFISTLFVDYEGINWGETQDTSLVGIAYEINTFNGNPTTYQYNITIIDWMVYDQDDGHAQFLLTVTVEEGAANAQLSYTAECNSQGFHATGTLDFESITQGGRTYLRFRDVTDQITITDNALYPGNVSTLNFDVSF